MRTRPRHTYFDRSWYLGSIASNLVLVGPLADAKTRWKQPPPLSFRGTIGNHREQVLIIPGVSRLVDAAGRAIVLFPPDPEGERPIRRVVRIPDGRVRLIRGARYASGKRIA